MSLTAAKIKALAGELGFNLCGITPARPSPTLRAYLRWIERGMQGGMGYMARVDRVRRRQNLREIMPSARSLILVGMDYYARFADEETLNDPARGRIAAYAWGLDYHKVLELRLEQFAERLAEASGRATQQKVYVDTGALLERSHAQQAGLGFIGKNTMLIHPRRGSSFFIGEIISSLEFDDYDEPHRETMCGTCARCLAACPTAAFPKPYVLDARRCISYHTIENKGWIDRELRADFGNWIFGCDICMDVCPFQRFVSETEEVAFLPFDIDRVAPPLTDILMSTADTHRALFRRSPVERIKREQMVRNACVAAGNWRDERAIPHLIQLLYDESALARGHAAWALWRTMGLDSSKLLTDLYRRDDDARVREEVAALLG
ncbi:MAG: tRNA epoxyqueuosine(34) reductase QueG [Chloroflexota bacterium]|nr:tRNA epoxyqueuosine(34) reductase QueG [Chloroflexota bacterium]